jgi:uncharacterized protein (TIGR04141 family)
MEGQWYEINVTYLGDMRAEIVDLFPAEPSVDLPAWAGQRKENDYCEDATVRPGLLCLDTRLVRGRFLRSGGGFEPCDLLGPADKLVHAKFARGSDTLSHAFTQGVISALALLDSPESRERFAETVSDVSGGRRTIDMSFRPELVVFALLPQKAKKNGPKAPRQMTPDTLSPLAQVALAVAARQLRARGVRVEVIGVPPADAHQAAA